MKPDLQKICAAMEAAEREAGALILSAGQEIRQTPKTGRRDVVTQYDCRVQALLSERLLAAAPNAAFFCEELGRQDALDGDCVFIIDPIDGTMNFVHGLRHSCVSVACACGGEIVAAAVYNPFADELFTAVKGEGARCNGSPIHVSDQPLERSVAHFGTAPYRPALAEESFALARRVFEKSLDVRRRGSAELDLCDVAAGRAGLYFELHVSLWDYAAGTLLVTEAGGAVCTAEGAPLPFDASKPTIAAGSAETVREFLALRG